VCPAATECLAASLVLRFYGTDFAAEEREKVTAWLGRIKGSGRHPSPRLPIILDGT
jgi:hypothetical protein